MLTELPCLFIPKMSMSFTTEYFKIAKGPNTSVFPVYCEVKLSNIPLSSKALKHNASHQLFSTQSRLVKTHEDLYFQSRMNSICSTNINTNLFGGNFPGHIYWKTNQSLD